MGKNLEFTNADKVSDSSNFGTVTVFQNDFSVFDDRNTVFFPNESRLSMYHRMILEICHQEGIKVDFLSDDWLLRLMRAGQCHYIFGYNFDLNNQAAGKIADDKYATYCLLRKKHLPVVDCAIFYQSNNKMSYAQGKNSLEYVAQYLHNHDDHIVIKPATGTCGQYVYQIQRELEIPQAYEKVFYQSYSAVMCPFYDIENEYRVILLDDTLRLAYRKVLNNATEWKFNLAAGAWSEKIVDDAQNHEIIALAQQTAAVMGLRFCSVDIIKTKSQDILVLEVNSGVMIKRFLLQHSEEYANVKALYRDAVKKMFV